MKRIYALVATLAIIILVMFPGKGYAAVSVKSVWIDFGAEYAMGTIKPSGSGGSIATYACYNGAGTLIGTWTISGSGVAFGNIINMPNPPGGVQNVRYIQMGFTAETATLTGMTTYSSINGGGTATSRPYNLTASNPTLLPAAPTNLVATAGDKQASLSWQASADEVTGYNLYQDGVKLNGSPIAALTYTVTGLTNGTSYSYQVTALDGTIESTKSAAVSVTPMAPPPVPPPAVPTGVTAADTGLKATVTWNANTESDLAGYNVYRDGTKANSSLVTGTTMDVTGLTRGQTYSFRVSAVNTSGKESDKSAESLVTIANVMDVQFIPNMDSIVLQLVGGSPPYSVDWGIGTDTFNATKYTITGLEPDTEYTVTVSDMAGQTATKTVNTGNMKAFNPPTMPDPVSMFQKMIDSFGSAGTIALAIIGGAVGLGILCIIGIWGWRLSKRWLSAAK